MASCEDGSADALALPSVDDPVPAAPLSVSEHVSESSRRANGAVVERDGAAAVGAAGAAGAEGAEGAEGAAGAGAAAVEAVAAEEETWARPKRGSEGARILRLMERCAELRPREMMPLLPPPPRLGLRRGVRGVRGVRGGARGGIWHVREGDAGGAFRTRRRETR